MSLHDPFDTEGEEHAAASKEQRARDEARLEIEDFKWLMSSKRGRRIVWRQLEDAHVFRSSFTGDSNTFFREGERNVGLKLMAKINEHCVEQYVLMLNEHRERMK